MLSTGSPRISGEDLGSYYQGIGMGAPELAPLWSTCWSIRCSSNVPKEHRTEYLRPTVRVCVRLPCEGAEDGAVRLPPMTQPVQVSVVQAASRQIASPSR